MHVLNPAMTPAFYSKLLLIVCLSFSCTYRGYAQEYRSLSGRNYGTPAPVNPVDTLQFFRRNEEAKGVLKTSPDSAYGMWREAYLFSKRVSYHFGIGKSILGMNYVYLVKGDVAAGLQRLKTVAGRLEALKEPRIDIECAIQFGKYYKYLYYRDTAVRYYAKALKLLEKHSVSDSVLAYYNIFNDLGELYMDKYADIPIAIGYFEKARKLALLKKDKTILASVLVGLGAAHANRIIFDKKNRDDYGKGLNYFKEALWLLQDSANDRKETIRNIYNNIATVYLNLDQLDSAAYFANKAWPGSLATIDSKTMDIHTLLLLGTGFMKRRNYAAAQKYLLYARTLCLALTDRKRLLEVDKLLYGLFIASRQYDRALAYLQSYTFLRDSLIDEQKIKTIADLEIKYQFSEKNRELAEKNLELNRRESQLREKNLWIWAIGMGCILLAGFLLVLWRNYQHRKLRLEEQQQLWQQGEEIRNLKATIAGEEKERARIGRELHDGIVGQLAAARMNFNMIQRKHALPDLREDFQEALNYLDETAAELRKTAHNIMPGILLDQGLLVAIDTFCEKTSTFTGIQIDVHLDDNIPGFDTDFELSVYRMIQELVQNIIKHADATRALVQLEYHDPLLILTVEDNGRGMDILPESTEGMGLRNLKARVRALQGNFEILGRAGEGTSVYIEFDISLLIRTDGL